MRKRALLRLNTTLLAGFAIMPLSSALYAAPPTEIQQQLIHAVIQDQIDAVPALLDRGGDPNARIAPAKEDAWALDHIGDDDPSPPLIVLACRYGSIKGPTIIEALLQKGADVNISDRNGVTPLMVAAQLGMGGFDLVLEHGAKVNATDKSGRTPLMYAMNNRGFNTVVALLDKGAKIDAQDDSGETPLMYAVRGAASDPILLIGEDQIKKAKEAKVRYLELIKLLIERKANVKKRDKAGETALKIAFQQRQPEVVQLLRKAGAKE